MEMMNPTVKSNEGSTWDPATISQCPLPFGTIPKQTEPNICQSPIKYASPLAVFSEPEGNELFTRRQTSSGGGSGKWPAQSSKGRIGDQKPYSKVLGESRKSFLDNNSDLPKELKQLFTPLKCQLCNCEMGSTITAKGHYKGKKHHSNIKKWFTDHPDLAGKYKVPEINRNITFDPEKLYCKYCDVMLSSQQQAEAHYAGKKHQEIINNKTMKNAFFNLQTGEWQRCETAKEDKTGRFAIGLSFLKVETDPAKTSDASGHRFFCDVCQIACPSRISLNDHLIGAKHKKKTAALSKDVPPPGDEKTDYKSDAGFEKSNETLIEDDKLSQEVPFQGKSLAPQNSLENKENTRSKRKKCEKSREYLDLYCGVCDKTMRDVASLVQHYRESKNHAKKLEKPEARYRCFACEKNFNGKDSMIEHLLSMGHEVMIAQNIFDYRFHRKMSETLDCTYCDFDASEIDGAIYHFLSPEHEGRLKSPKIAIDGTLIEPCSKFQPQLGKSCDSESGVKNHLEEIISPKGSKDPEIAFRVGIAPKIIDADAFFFCSVCKLKIFGGKSHLLKHLKGFGHSATLRDPTFEMKIYLDYGAKYSTTENIGLVKKTQNPCQY